MTKTPPTYRVCNTCYDCIHVYIRGNWDDPNHYFCTLRAPYRPHSMGEGECRRELSLEKKKERWARWEEWAEGRQVDEYGTCDEWQAKRVQP